PHCPALDQTSTLPWRSVIVTIVLLTVEWMCSTPSDTERFALRRRAGASAFAAALSGSFAMLVPQLTSRAPSSCRRPSCADPSGCGRSCGCVGHGPEDSDDAACRDS